MRRVEPGVDRPCHGPPKSSIVETFYLLAAAPKGVGPTDLADQYNEPGRFTAIIGYEYTTRGGYNLHRNVLFRGDASVANQTLPFSQFDSQNPEDL